ERLENGAAALASEVAEDAGKPLGANLDRAEHGAEILFDKIGRAAVDEQELEKVVAEAAALDKLQRRQADAFLEDFGGRGIVGAGGGPPRGGLVRAIAGPGSLRDGVVRVDAFGGKGGDPSFDEDRTDDRQIGEVVAASDIRVA